jgi:phosphohistidine phosphatase
MNPAGVLLSLLGVTLSVFMGFNEAEPVKLEENPRILYLLRHAKSNHDNPSLADFDRPLDSSGISEAETIGKFMKEKAIYPDLIICSPALRTKQTCEIICTQAGYSIDMVVWDSTLYACNAEQFITSIKQAQNADFKVLIIGHNNAITEVANKLQSNIKIDEVKTCGLVAITFNEIHSWQEIGKGKLLFYRKP